jgi:hypothetical protein
MLKQIDIKWDMGSYSLVSDSTVLLISKFKGHAE